MNWLAIDFAGERRWRAAAARDAARMAAAAAELPDRGLRPIPAHAAGPDNKTTTDAGSLERSDAQKNPDEAPKCTVSSQSGGCPREHCAGAGDRTPCRTESGHARLSVTCCGGASRPALAASVPTRAPQADDRDRPHSATP